MLGLKCVVVGAHEPALPSSLSPILMLDVMSLKLMMLPELVLKLARQLSEDEKVMDLPWKLPCSKSWTVNPAGTLTELIRSLKPPRPEYCPAPP